MKIEHIAVYSAQLEEMKEIYVRYFDQPRLSNYLRISIGTREEMEELFAFLEKYLAE